MKKHNKVFCLIVTAAFTVTANAQKVDVANYSLTNNLPAAQYQDTTAPAPVNTDAATIINDYLKAIGGVEELKKVNTMYLKSGMEIQGTQLNIESKKMAPNLEVTTVAMGGNVVNKNVFDGKTGFQEQMGNRTNISDENLKDKKAQTTLFEQVDYLLPSYKLTVQGINKVSDKDAYKLLITLPSGSTQTEYYDVQSKLLVKIEKADTVQNLSVVTIIAFSDYRKVENVMVPYKQSVSVAGGGQQQSFEMNISDIKLNEGVTTEDFKQ